MHAVVVGVGALILGWSALAQAGARSGLSGSPGGLLTPSAEHQTAGYFALGASYASPYRTLNLNVQPFDWLHVRTGYVDITDRPYGPGLSQSYKDKSFDFSLRLLEERVWLPGISIGIQDLGGTGLFAGEFVALSKSTSEWAATVGIGWGRLGRAGDFDNPLGLLGESLKQRQEGTLNATGGTPSTSRWFRGQEVGLFGHLTYQPRWARGFSATVELDGNDYSNEPAGQPVTQKSRVNFGFGYRHGGSNISLAYLRGDALGLSLQTSSLIGKDFLYRERSYAPALSQDEHPAYRARLPVDFSPRLSQFARYLLDHGYFLHAMDYQSTPRRLVVWQSNTRSDRMVDTFRFVSRAALNYLGDDVATIRVVTMAGGLPVASAERTATEVTAEARDEAEVGVGLETSRRNAAEVTSSSVESWVFSPSSRDLALRAANFPSLLRYPTASAGINPALRSNIGGPTRFFATQIQAKPFLTLQLARNLSLSAVAAVEVYDGLDDLQRFTSGTLPPVRSELEIYQSSTDTVYLDELELNYNAALAPDWFGRLSAGIFEEMYGGVAGEVLYRPYAKRWALSLNMNYVVKRGYEQRFSFLDYRTATGHLTLHYRTPFQGIHLSASVGRYLARDIGGTLEVTRVFRNGTQFGLFATKTNVSSEEFGEGSFDKGFFIRIPVSELGLGGKGVASFNYRYLTRDGGAKVNDGVDLYSVVGAHQRYREYE